MKKKAKKRPVPTPSAMDKPKWSTVELLQLRIPWETVKDQAKSVLGEDWDRMKCLHWLKEGRQFISRAHEQNVGSVVGMVMKFKDQASKKPQQPPTQRKGRIWTP